MRALNDRPRWPRPLVGLMIQLEFEFCAGLKISELIHESIPTMESGQGIDATALHFI
jgi:hypothetical protein